MENSDTCHVHDVRMSVGWERGRGRETYMENSDTCHVHDVRMSVGWERGRGRETYMENSDTCHVHEYMSRLGMCVVCMHACIAIVYTCDVW